MTEHHKRVESHGCIVCGRLYNMLVVYAPDGRLVDCTVTGPGGRRVVDPDHPLAACDSHLDEQVKTAYARRKAASQPDETGEDG